MTHKEQIASMDRTYELLTKIRDELRAELAAVKKKKK